MFASVKTKLNVGLFKGSSVVKKTKRQTYLLYRFTGYLLSCKQ